MIQPTTARTDYSKRLTDLHRCLNALHKQRSLQEAVNTVVLFLQESFGFDCIWIGQYHREQSLLTGLGGHLKNGDAKVLRRNWTVLPGEWFDQILLTGTLTETPNLQEEKRAGGEWQAIAQKYAIQGAMFLPIRYRHQSYGIVGVGSELWGTYPRPEELTELQLIVSTLGFVISTLTPESPIAPSTQKSPATEWFALEQILNTPSFEGRIEKALAIAFDAIKPTKASFYRIDPTQYSCFLQISYAERQGKQGYIKPHTRLEISLNEIAPFFQALSRNPILGVADINSVTESQSAPTRLMGLAKVQASLNVAVYQKQQILGFLALEEQVPRIWSDDHKQILKILGQLLSESAILQESPQERSELDRLLEVLGNPICDSPQWFGTLQQTLNVLCLRSDAQWAAIYDYVPEQQQFIYVAKGQTPRKKTTLPDLLPGLSDLDAALLERSMKPIQINLAAQELKFLNWHPILLDLGSQGILVVKMKTKRGIDTVLLLATDHPPQWMAPDCDTLHDLAKTLDLAIQSHRDWQQTTSQHRILQEFVQGFNTLQRALDWTQRFAAAGETLQKLLRPEALCIVHWIPTQPITSVDYGTSTSSMEISRKIPIDWKNDPLLVQVHRNCASTSQPQELQFFSWTESLIASQADPWIASSRFIEGFALPLRCPMHEETFGIILVFSPQSRRWANFEQEGAALVATFLAELCRAEYVQVTLTHKREKLECLNWYKHRQLEALVQNWQAQTSHLQAWLPPKEANLSSSIRSRKHQPIEVLSQSFQSIEKLLKTEVWQLSTEAEVLPLASLLRRSLLRIDPVVKERQLWTQVHQAPANVVVQAPALQLELILAELLLASCYRTKIGSRVDVWCRLPAENWIEISITDTGRLNPQLTHDIQVQSYRSPLYRSATDTLPGLHFKVCQVLILQLGGQFEIGQLEDGRVFSRLVLPIKSTS
jgi:hypothetical protein